MKPLHKKGSITTAYRQWLTQKRPYKKVVLIDFLGFVYKQGRFFKNLPKPFYTPEKEAFIAELWKVQCLNTGEIFDLKLRHPFINEGKEESSLVPNLNPIYDLYEANILLDSYEEFSRNIVDRRIYPNKLLKKANQRFEKRKENIKNLLESEESLLLEKVILFLMLRHKESPTMETFNALKNWKSQNKDLYDQLLIKIQNYETNQNTNADDIIESV